MIPKIVHYSWFSGEPFPDMVSQCMASWKRLLPDYEFVLWDRERVNEIDSVFLTEALAVRKWAFAADLVRCYAVYTYGGIWLDTDVEIINSFDAYLRKRMFIGKEGRSIFNVADSFRHMYALTAHCFGAEAGHPFLKRCLEYYQNRHFITSTDKSLPKSLQYDMRLLPEIMSIIAAGEFGYNGSLDTEEKIEEISEDMTIYPFYVFDLPRYHQPQEVVAIHYLLGGWVDGSSVRPAIRYFRKKDLKYYLFTWFGKLLGKRRLKLNLQSY